jgi:hypothetical protein
MSKVYALIAAFFLSVKTAFKAFIDWLDIRDFLMLGGFLLLGYGLYLFSPWVSFSIAGVLLMATGFFWKGK